MASADYSIAVKAFSAFRKKSFHHGPGAFKEFPGVYGGRGILVREGGFEPPRLAAPPPQDGVSANSTPPAEITYGAGAEAGGGAVSVAAGGVAVAGACDAGDGGVGAAGVVGVTGS